MQLPALAPDVDFLLTQTLGSSSGDWGGEGPATYVGDLDGVPGLHPAPVPVIAGIWSGSQGVGTFCICVFLYFYFSDK